MKRVTCYVLATRLIPDQDGGFALAVMRRADDIASLGIPVTVLTVDPAATADHQQHRKEWARRGALSDGVAMRNLFDDARADPEWLRRAATGTITPADVEYREIRDANGRLVLSLPVVNDPRWHATHAPVLVYGDDGSVAGSVAGFGGLYQAWLSHVVADDAVVIVEARQLGELLVSWQSPARLIHTVHTSHVEAPYTPDATVNALWQSWFGVADRFDAVVWPTQGQLNDVRARFGGDRADVVVPNSIEVRAGAGERNGASVIMVNRLAPGKRVDLALRAFALVVGEVPEARLDIYGDGPERERLELLRDELGLSPFVRFHGQVVGDDIDYGAAALMLLTSAYEGQSLVVGEALAAGTPVVSFDVNYGPREALQDGGGVLVPSGDVEALARAVARVLSDASLRSRLSDETAIAFAPFSRPTVATQWLHLLTTLPSRSPQ